MAIMKVFDGKQTHYIFRPEDIVQVYDDELDDVAGVAIVPRAAQPIHIVTDKNARDIKREIQANSDEPIGYLKLDDEQHVKKGRRYINAKYIVATRPKKVRLSVEGSDTEIVDGSLLSIDHHSGSTTLVAADPFEVARQIRRILIRLDQDEDLCCGAEAADEEETE